ncbi:methyltransferase domain-containing protein [uncultured Enterovirga sp.]|uniref:class I SAM-dependent DNA methyltransferase n=1 Tax=uncultured Enterovirga sp. TaxID=2026352 RepID=UPI0035CC408A
MHSSGDLLADRRYGYAEASFQESDWEAAADLARQALDLAPGFAAAWFLLGRAREAQLRTEPDGPDAAARRVEAVQAFENARALDPEDRQGAGARLAMLGIGDPMAAISPGYVRALFDDYAIRFDRHLVRSLRYRAPELIHEAVRRAASLRLRPFRFEAALDLGCGTGLAAELFRPVCDTLAGIDLSPAMLERARSKRLYDDLAEGDLLPWLAARPAASVDLVLAADVFVYLGDLGPVFAETARVLRPGGLFAFTVQAHPGEGVILGDDLRYAHGEAYLRALAAEDGLALPLLEDVSTREDRGEPVPGRLAVLAR